MSVGGARRQRITQSGRLDAGAVEAAGCCLLPPPALTFDLIFMARLYLVFCLPFMMMMPALMWVLTLMGCLLSSTGQQSTERASSVRRARCRKQVVGLW